MNWYKAATEVTVPITPERFRAMTWAEKWALAHSPSLTPEVQLLFFAEEYAEKSEALQHLASNPSLTPEVQKLFFTEEYERKGDALLDLAKNESITPETQRLFFTEEYNCNGYALYYLADNRSITPEVQLLFFTEELYGWKDEALKNLVRNHSFLRDFTRAQWLQIKNAARGGMRLQVLKKRLEQAIGVP